MRQQLLSVLAKTSTTALALALGFLLCGGTSARMSESQLQGAQKAKWLSIKGSDRKSLQAQYAGPAHLKRAIEDGSAEALSLAAADFDSDGFYDLACGYKLEQGGLLSIYRGNPDSIYAKAKRNGVLNRPFFQRRSCSRQALRLNS